MAVDVSLLFNTEYPEVGGDNPNGVAGYAVRGAANWGEAFAGVNAEAPAVDGDTGLRKLRIKMEQPGPGLYVGYVTYGIQNYIDTLPDPAPPPPPGSPPPPSPSSPSETDALGGEFAFSTTGGTQHITQSRSTIEKKGIAGEGAPPDPKGAIGLARDGTVQGVGIVAPKLEFSIATKPPYFTLKMVKKYRDMTGRVNGVTWWTFEPGEVLFMGADGRVNKSDGASLNMHFAAGRNRHPADADPDNRTTVAPDLTFDSDIEAWHHVWVAYRDTVSNGVSTQVPFAAYLEKVYASGDFTNLGIG